MTWTNPGNLTGLGDMFTYTNIQSNDAFSSLIVIVIFFIAFISSKIGQLETTRSMVFASFVTLMLASIGYTIKHFIPGKTVIFLLALLILSAIMHFAVQD